MRQGRTSPGTAAAARLLLSCALLTPLSACQQRNADARFDDTPQWLATASWLNASHGHVARAPALPPMVTQWYIAASGLEGLDILTLRGCAVQQNINRRDTSLARNATPSQQLLLTLEYLRLAPPCIRRLRARDAALANRLHTAWRQQRAQLPALIFNATLGGDEFRAFWRAAPTPGEYPPVDACETAAALRAIETSARRWLGGEYQIDDRDFELWLSAVAGGAGAHSPQAIIGLEALLDAVLPPAYRRWMEDRARSGGSPALAPGSERQALDSTAACAPA